MRKFIISTISFSIPIIIILLIIEILLRTNNNSYYFLKKKALVKQIDSYELLILGSSAENSGINPAFISLKGINLAFVGGTSIDVFNLLVLKYVDKMPKLKKILIPISIFTLFATEERDEMKFRKILLNRYFGLFNDISSLSLQKLMVLNLGLKRSINTIFNMESNHVDKYGYDHLYGNLPACLSDNYGKKTVIRHIGQNVECLKGEVFKNNLKILVETIKYLKKRNIKIYLVTAPAHESYYKNINEKLLKTIYKEINNLTAIYKIKYFNYLKDNRFIVSDFYNCDHLNVIGAEKFSIILNDEVFNKD